jgi:hypothetical protein
LPVPAIGRATSSSAGMPMIQNGATIWRTYSGASQESSSTTAHPISQAVNSFRSGGERSASQTCRTGRVTYRSSAVPSGCGARPASPRAFQNARPASKVTRYGRCQSEASARVTGSRSRVALTMATAAMR